VDYAYNAISQVTNKKRYSDITGTNLVAETNNIYDNLNHLTNITHSNGAIAISSYAQTYDAGSKITGVTGTDGSSTYTYDNTNQLTGADYNFQADESYTYDSNGNRTNNGYVTGVNNRLLEDSKYLYEYDLVGNRTKRTDKLTGDMTDYGWDIRDRLTGLVVRNALGDVTKTAQYKYDVYNQRIAKTVDADGDGAAVATTERYVYGANQNIDLIFDENGNVNHRYLFGDGVDQIEADESNGNVLWALSDHLGSVRDVVDDSGTVLNHVVYDAFGGVTSQTNASVVFRYGYTARELDAESGLQYNRARYLDSFTGKFISEDPISFQGGDFNLSRYVENSPINGTDPFGLETIILIHSGTHWYGHTALEVNGTVYTFGRYEGKNGLLFSVPTNRYYDQDEDVPYFTPKSDSVSRYKINTSPEEEKKIENYFRTLGSKGQTHKAETPQYRKLPVKAILGGYEPMLQGALLDNYNFLANSCNTKTLSSLKYGIGERFNSLFEIPVWYGDKWYGSEDIYPARGLGSDALRFTSPPDLNESLMKLQALGRVEGLPTIIISKTRILQY
jgi:RHS repeat-associated protein